jgi:hypothetical protein
MLQEDVAFFVVSVDDVPAGCGGVQLFDREYAELKRMHVRPEFRRQGLVVPQASQPGRDGTSQHQPTPIHLAMESNRELR